MSGSLTNTGEDRALNAATGRATVTTSTCYLALATTDPGEAATLGTVSELTTPATNGYNRQQVTWAAPGGDGTTETSGSVTFGPFSADLGTVSHVFITPEQTATSGEVWAYWAVDTSRNPDNGDSITVDAGGITLTIN